MPTASSCRWKFYGYDNICGKPATPSGMCEEHAAKVCAGCGGFATRDCPREYQFVCGYPICACVCDRERGHRAR